MIAIAQRRIDNMCVLDGAIEVGIITKGFDGVGASQLLVDGNAMLASGAEGQSR